MTKMTFQEIFDIIIKYYFLLADKGFNVISIVLTIFFVDYLKTKVFPKFKFYSVKWKNVINLITGLIISFLFALVFYIFLPGNKWEKIIYTSVSGFVLSIASHNIIKAIWNIIPTKKVSDK